MHAIHPHMPRATVIALVAALLTILVVLVFFTARVGDISLGLSSSGGGSLATTASTISTPAQSREPSWLANPLAPPFQQRIVLPWKAPAVRR